MRPWRGRYRLEPIVPLLPLEANLRFIFPKHQSADQGNGGMEMGLVTLIPALWPTTMIYVAPFTPLQASVNTK